MNDKSLIGTGIAGFILSAICCGTPLLVLALGSIGLSAWLAWTDYVVMPAMLLFLGLAAYGLYLRRQRQRLSEPETRQAAKPPVSAR